MAGMEEVWEPTTRSDGYEVSSLGRVRSVDIAIKRTSKNGKSFLRKMRGRILKPGKPGGNNKYFFVCLCRSSGTENKQKIRPVSIHRLVAIAFIPNPNKLPEVNHINGNKLDNRVENLEWVTSSENRIHAFKQGKHPHGERHKWAKISDKQYFEIINKYSGRLKRSKPSLKDIAKEYGVSFASISLILLNKTRRFL